MVPSTETESQSDVWSNWVLHVRHANNAAMDQAVRADTRRYADRVLDSANLKEGMILADIGTGDGLLAFRAIERIGPKLRVILTDISAALLDHTKLLAAERGVEQQCSFLLGSAEKLTGIPDSSVDVVTTRAVLAYVPDKVAALREFHRVLKPGGRISVAEPIFFDEAFATCSLKKSLDAQPKDSQDRYQQLLYRWKAAQFPDTQEKMAASAIANYSERTLVELTRAAGFVQIHMELHIDVLPAAPASWEVFIGSSPHPLAPPLSVIMAEQFTPEEREYFELILRPQVESGGTLIINRILYLNATKGFA